MDQAMAMAPYLLTRPKLGRMPEMPHQDVGQMIEPRVSEPRAQGASPAATMAPDPLEEERQILVGGRINVESLILMEARPCAGETDPEIVSGAWDFERINRRFARHLKILDERPGGALGNEVAARALQRWAAAEREAWLHAVTSDPLLPERILPPDYLGKQAWRRRIEALREAGRQLHTFQP